MGAGLCPGPDHGYPGLVPPVCFVCARLVGRGESGHETARTGGRQSGDAPTPRRLTAAGPVGLELGECDGRLAQGGQKLVFVSLRPH